MTMYVAIYLLIGSALAIGYIRAKHGDDATIGVVGLVNFLFTFFSITFWWPMSIVAGLGTIFFAWVERNSNV